MPITLLSHQSYSTTRSFERDTHRAPAYAKQPTWESKFKPKTHQKESIWEIGKKKAEESRSRKFITNTKSTGRTFTREATPSAKKKEYKTAEVFDENGVVSLPSGNETVHFSDAEPFKSSCPETDESQKTPSHTVQKEHSVHDKPVEKTPRKHARTAYRSSIGHQLPNHNELMASFASLSLEMATERYNVEIQKFYGDAFEGRDKVTAATFHTWREKFFANAQPDEKAENAEAIPEPAPVSPTGKLPSEAQLGTSETSNPYAAFYRDIIAVACLIGLVCCIVTPVIQLFVGLW